MFSLEVLFCPCCTGALLQTLAQSELTHLPRQTFWLGQAALSTTLSRHMSHKKASSGDSSDAASELPTKIKSA